MKKQDIMSTSKLGREQIPHGEQQMTEADAACDTLREEETEAVAGESDCCCHYKATPRQEKELKQLKNRLNRMIGQLNGIGRMLDDNRYCGDILMQIAAVESALQAFGYVVLKEHMETCVVEEIQKGNTSVVEETVELIKKLAQ